MSKTTFNERDLDFIVTALNAHWYDAHHNLERKDLGDIERKNYEFQLARSKELMGSITNDSQLHPSPTPDVTPVEDGKQVGEDILIKALTKIQNPIKAMQDELEEGYQLDGRMAMFLSTDHNYLKDIARTALEAYKSLPSTPVQPGERINKVKDAIGFLLSCAYPEMIASEYNRNKEVLTEICKLIDTIATSTPVQDGWVKIEDGLPSKAGKYIVYGRYAADCPMNVFQSNFYKKDKSFRTDIKTKGVTHWQPLPSPPVNKQD